MEEKGLGGEVFEYLDAKGRFFQVTKSGLVGGNGIFFLPEGRDSVVPGAEKEGRKWPGGAIELKAVGAASQQEQLKDSGGQARRRCLRWETDRRLAEFWTENRVGAVVD